MLDDGSNQVAKILFDVCNESFTTNSLVTFKFKIMRNLTYKFSVVVFILFYVNIVFSQIDSLKQEQSVVVKMNNGDEFLGEIIQQDKEIVVIKTINGEFKIIAANVKSIIKNEYKGVFKFANTNDTRYFFGPSGIPIKKGKGYYQNVLATGNFINGAISKNLSIGGGFEFISTMLGHPIWFLTPKVAFNVTDKIHIGAGFIMAGSVEMQTATLAYNVITFGSSESNITFGGGAVFSNGEFSTSPTIMISATHRVSNSIALLTENYILTGSSDNATVFGIHGIRIISKKNSFDIGAIVVPDNFDNIPALPYIGYVRVF